MSRINKREIQRMLKRFKTYHKKVGRKFEKDTIYLLRKTGYDDSVELPKPPHELSILNSQIEVLELILKNNK